MPETTKLLLPKFLTKELAEIAINTAVNAAQGFNRAMERIKHGPIHVVVLVPAMQLGGEYPNFPILPHLLAERSFGESKEKWKYPFDDIARCKAMQRWHDCNDGGTDILPHLLFPGDTPFCGSVKRCGIVAACSGVQPHFDRMIASIAADACIAFAYDECQRSPDRANEELCFLSS